MKIQALLALALLWVSGQASAIPTTIDFESLASDGDFMVEAGPTYSEDGFTFTNLSKNDSRSFLSAGSGKTQFYAGSAALVNNEHNGITKLTKDSSEVFDIFSIDLTEIDVDRLGPTTVDFIGNLSGGGTVNQSFSLDGVFGFETFLFSGFENLTSLTWTQTSDYHQFDNIMIDANVPEPGMLALLAIGLAGVGFTRRKI